MVYISDVRDALDIQRDAFAEALAHRIGLSAKVAGNPFVRGSLLEQVRAYAIRTCIAGAADWSRNDVANYAMGQGDLIKGFRDAANVVSGNFPNFVTLNAMKKIVASGFEQSKSTITYTKFCEPKPVPDFKSYHIGGMGTANLQQTAENTAFPELIKSEGSYSDTVKMWGGTLSLTFQALVNDDTREFDRSLNQSGAIAQKTIEKRVYQKLLMGTSSDTASSTWTSNTTSGCSPVWTSADTLVAARAKINMGVVGLMNKVGLDGNPLGNRPRFYIAGPTAGQFLAGLLAPVGGQTVGNGYVEDVELVISPWLESSALAGTSNSTYYILADPMAATGMVLATITGMENPQVQEYDAGAVGMKRWKVWHAFEADLFSVTYGGTGLIPAAQQCTT